LRNKQQCLIENQEIDETEFLVDGGSYLTVPARHELTGQFNYSERYYAEKMVSACLNAGQPLSFLLVRQSSQCMQLAQTVQTPLQLRSAESSARWPNADRGGAGLDSIFDSLDVSVRALRELRYRSCCISCRFFTISESALYHYEIDFDAKTRKSKRASSSMHYACDQ